MPTAPSYTSLPVVRPPYSKNDKMYVDVQGKNGVKTVRWYSEAEFNKAYGNKAGGEDAIKFFKTQREILGFGEKGYIIIFKGDTYTNKDWFKEHGARYTRWWGWSVFSENDITDPLPAGITAIRLDWDKVGSEFGSLKTDEQIRMEIESIIYDEDVSQFVGMVGDKIETTVRIENIVKMEGYYGTSTMFIMRDVTTNNIFVWNTSTTKAWEIGDERTIRGTIKDHNVYKAAKQTILTRCSERPLQKKSEKGAF